MSVVLVGLWLVVVGVADLGRTAVGRPSLRRRATCLAVGLLALAAGLLAVDMAVSARMGVGVVLALLLAGWVVATRRTPAALCLVGGLLVGAFSATVVTEERVWPQWLQPTVLGDYSTSAVLVVTGVLLFQLSTANLVVRMLLDAVGVPATTNEKQLRGGRVLGPMERVLLVCLGALGEVTAASIVIAAKGLLRFPEIQRAQRETQPPPAGPSDVTEYFLIGSLASWMLALAGAGLISWAT